MANCSRVTPAFVRHRLSWSPQYFHDIGFSFGVLTAPVLLPALVAGRFKLSLYISRYC
ncbi:hypothetical protein GCM10010519_16010 [Streptomyces lactacystinicus]